MSKDLETIEEVLGLFEQHIRNHSRINKVPELSKEQALQQIEKIIDRDVIGDDVRFNIRVEDKDADTRLAVERGINKAKHVERNRLTNALYGKGERNV